MNRNLTVLELSFLTHGMRADFLTQPPAFHISPNRTVMQKQRPALGAAVVVVAVEWKAEGWWNPADALCQDNKSLKPTLLDRLNIDYQGLHPKPENPCKGLTLQTTLSCYLNTCNSLKDQSPDSQQLQPLPEETTVQ